MAAATNTIGRIAGYRVRSGGGMADFIGHVFRGVEQERRRKLSDHDRRKFAAMESQARDADLGKLADVKALAGMFARLRDQAARFGAPQVSGAVVQAAAWFWANVEQPLEAAQGGSGGGFQPSALSQGGEQGGEPGGRRGGPPARRGGKRPLTKQVWFWPAVIGGVGILAATGILLVGRR